MAEFLFIYRGGSDLGETSPEQMQQLMQKWMEWIGGGMQAGWMIDGGDALKDGGRVLKVDDTVTDGPYPESKELVGGYSIIKAKDYDEALEYAQSCPHHDCGDPTQQGSIEIRELAKLGQEE